MTRRGVFLAVATLLVMPGPLAAQTTAGTSATIVVPVIAQTSSFGSEVTVYNPNAGTITVNPIFYDAQNTASPGPKACTSLAVGANVSKAFAIAAQCALPSGSNFGLLVLSESTGTNRFYGYARTQTPQGIGFSTEGFPIENFNDQLQHATGLKRVAASVGLPAYQTNCFVATLGDAVSYELRLFDGATKTQLGSTLSGSLAAFQQFRYLDVFAAAGVAAGNKTNVRAQFTNVTGNNKKLIGFCTVQENTSFSADFRIAKSYGGTPQNAFVEGGNAFGTTALLGTTDAQPLSLLINGAFVMRYLPGADAQIASPNLIAGSPANDTAGPFYSGQVIAGGGKDGADCLDPISNTSTRSCGNQVASDFATVGGGFANIASGVNSTVAGGQSNTASGYSSFVGGGTGNTASGSSYATVSGGSFNISNGQGTAIGGGSNNNAAGVETTVGGGNGNEASGFYATVGGGLNNVASSDEATVIGGSTNTASSTYSTVAGGANNTASGILSTTVGGSSNTASGFLSFAAGHRAKATTNGTFMWADSREFDFQPSVSNFFGARATGGVGFTVAIDPTTGGVTQFCNLLPGNPSWQCTSDRNAKENFRAIDAKDILARLIAMPITTWNFKGADPAQRALGPTAQDFYAAFGLGDDDKSIATSNLASVGLAAIQGLHQLVLEKDAEIRAQHRAISEQQHEIEDLRDALDVLKRAVGQLTHWNAAVAGGGTQ